MERAGYTLGYDVPRVALTWMHLPPFARAIILSARLNATPVYAQVTSSLSLSLSLSPVSSPSPPVYLKGTFYELYFMNLSKTASRWYR